MTTWTRTAGDSGDTIVVTMHGVTDLTGATSLTAKVQPMADSTATPTTLTATVTDAANSKVTVQLGSWLAGLTAPGRYRVWTKITFGGGVSLTWPAALDDVIVVTAP